MVFCVLGARLQQPVDFAACGASYSSETIGFRRLCCVRGKLYANLKSSQDPTISENFKNTIFIDYGASIF